MNNNIPQQVLQSLKQIGQETVEQTGKQLGKIIQGAISPRELLGDIGSMTPEEMAKKRTEEENKRQQEMAQLRAQMSGQGRNLEQEMEQIRREKEQKEKEAEETMLRQVQMQREQERQEIGNMLGGESANPAKRKKKRGSALATGKKKSQQPDQSQMSQTSEFKGKID